MYSLIRTVPPRELVTQSLPALGASMIVAERFYHFHSFTLECAAFLATWYVLDLVARTVAGLRRERD